MSVRKSHQGTPFDPLKGAMRRVRRLASNLTRSGRGAFEAVDPFGATIDKASRAAIAGSLAGEGDGSPAELDVAAELARHSRRLGPLVKRRLLDFDDVPGRLTLGWAQLPGVHGNGGFSLGVFADRDHFSQIAYADAKGRVYVGAEIGMDVQGRDPRFMFTKEPRHDRVGGGIVGRDDNGRMNWLASWRRDREDGTYTLEQMRYVLPERMRTGLEFRDAVAVAFFAAYMLPQMHGMLIGFGAGNIFRRLNREAPMGAIRRSVRDMLGVRAHGMRVSGLEDHFAELMREAGALDEVPSLEAVHGAEPLHLYTSSYSGSYFFTWDSSLSLAPALRALAIEGNLNRFSAVSAWLERNARLGLEPTEDTVTRAQAATIDLKLLDDPALIALGPDLSPAAAAGGDAGAGVAAAAGGDASGPDAGHNAMSALIRTARSLAWSVAYEGDDESTGSEWEYRQGMAQLVRSLRLPYRFDVEIRSNLAEGRVAVGFTTAGVSMMPASRYDEASHRWVTLSEGERAEMSAAYNLRVGLIMAALSFAASDDVREVSLHVDSLGLEEAVAEQDSAIEEMMSEALSAFERMHTGDMGAVRGKSEPKDGDLHGDPARTQARPAGAAPAEPVAADTTVDSASDGRADGDDSVDRRFEDLMKDVDIDETAFAMPSDAPSRSESFGIAADGDGRGAGDAPAAGDADDPMNVLKRNPTVRNLATVTFTRDAFLTRIEQDALDHPMDTYRMFDAVMDVDGDGALKPVDAGFDLRDPRFAPAGAQEQPEASDHEFGPDAARVLGTDHAVGLSIQRVDLLQRAEDDFHRLASDGTLPSVAKAQAAMRIVDMIGDPELTEQAPNITNALIDGRDTPELTIVMGDELDKERLKARDLLFGGQIDQAIDTAEAAIARLDALYAKGDGVPRYFNSYAERVIYNRLFATPGERTVLIPDNLFYAHMELADVLAQIKGARASLKHLNAMVAYAPAYPLTHLKLAVQLARGEDWDSARAACLNALRVALDRDDAAFAYYRFAYTEWMQDRFATAVAAYLMSDHIAPGQISSLEGELQELVARADSQCIRVPETVDDAAQVLAEHDLPVWPHTEVGAIVRDAARTTVDEGMFVPARTLSVAAARMNDDDGTGIDVVQAQFIRSLNG
ncbi:tetratricopeptide repeat protein [Bifidobacterium platyrrhinorum]|uniref:Tetratricopeptide repeat protein n=1 Tax=Bifidobacterium platyrrhinorum TaxID=2661628 RepID=A0A6L9SXB1_9BIFI|nr:tetratricopeptide repeat protein [Bifidobacterium platyrrhinorum]NEG55791.1 tetratricopeptide repeat protein [Bifidobacterium platyrrhinorum]